VVASTSQHRLQLENRTTDGGAHEVNFVANYYQPGPATKWFYALNAQYGGFPGTQRYYFEGNVMPGHFGLANQSIGRTATTERGGKLPTDYSPWVDQPFFAPFVKTHTAVEAYTNVLANVGCNFPSLDEHDQRVIAEVRAGTFKFQGSKTGLPGLRLRRMSAAELSGSAARRLDTDRDGMPAHGKRHGESAVPPTATGPDRRRLYQSRKMRTRLGIPAPAEMNFSA
jgi:hypothetical protein